MANCILNQVYIEGPTSQMEAFYNTITKDGQIDFNQIISQPSELKSSDVAEWRLKNWGTESNALTSYIFPCTEYDDIAKFISKCDSCSFWFVTKSKMPKPIMNHLANLFPDLEIEWSSASEYESDWCALFFKPLGHCESMMVAIANKDAFIHEIWGQYLSF